MGFQILVAAEGGFPRLYIVIGGIEAYDISDLSLRLTEDPVTNGLRVSEAMATAVSDRQTVNLQNAPVASSRIAARFGLIAAAGKSPLIAPSALVKTVTLTAPRRFFRFSAFNQDKRVNANGEFAAGTYAAPESETGMVPSGFAAVGRFALPNTSPASFKYTIEAPIGTVVHSVRLRLHSDRPVVVWRHSFRVQ